ncbi:hypothetical protein [Archangium lipolyticum]|uniref:hypothetical protein n=1 Tax=Archangium lipolyticum TaxID=2970465 RepID=UPI002149AFF6|nr:hypothetical protein [Archangium lipolyticum]
MTSPAGLQVPLAFASLGDDVDHKCWQAGTESGLARERELISLLGPECFYDHERLTLPTRRPVLDAPGQPPP